MTAERYIVTERASSYEVWQGCGRTESHGCNTFHKQVATCPDRYTAEVVAKALTEYQRPNTKHLEGEGL